jgi:FMN-dependent oxidoreductase (nitrilotriacetate monooxygenase family)
MSHFPSADQLRINTIDGYALSNKHRKFHLGWFGAAGPSNWLVSAANIYDWRKSDLYIEMAKLCERVKFDFFFFGDNPSVPDLYRGSRDFYIRHGNKFCHDPIPTAAMMASHTNKIGFATTISTSLYPPFLMARMMATLDHLSSGRVAWNIVTSFSNEAAKDYGLDELPEHDLRYDMADEYVEVVNGLWDSWEPDALVENREQKIFADPSKVHALNYEGKFYRTRGPLTVVPSPQGRPVTIVAGASPRGLRFAVEHGEMVIIHKNSIAEIKKYCKEFRKMLEDAGRDPHSCKIFTSIKPTIAETQAKAEDKWAQAYANSDIEYGLSMLSTTLGKDMSQFELNAPLPADLQTNALRGKLAQYGISEERWTLREIAKHEGMYETIPICGTPEHVADMLEQAASESDIDGFHFRSQALDYEYLFQVASELIPILQKRDLVRSDYGGSTLREHLFEF